MTLAHLRRVIASSVLCWAAAAPSGAATINAPATSTGTFTASWPSGYELRLADVNWRVAAAGVTSATFTAVPPGEYRFVLAACSWSITAELGALYLCNLDQSSAKTVTVGGAPAPAVEEWTAEAGSTPYRAGVGPRGNAEIAVPLRIPGGMNGVALELALEYDSARNGDRPRYVADDLLGYGWALRGVPYIHRCRAGSTLDSSLNGLPTLTSSDGICLDGEPLVKVGGTHWSAGAEYRKAADPDLRVTLRETSGVGRWFEVRYPDGAIARFGDTLDSRVLASGQAMVGSTAPVPSETYLWGLRSLTGALGNVLTVSYRRFDGYGHLQPETVAYGGAEVRFRYGARRDLAPLAITGTARVRRLSVLQGVEARMNGKALREYRLASRADAGGRLRLEAIQECGYDEQGTVASCLPPLRMQWDAVTGGAMGYPIAITELTDGLGARTGFAYTTVTAASNPLGYGEAPFGSLLAVADTQATDVAAVAEFRVSDGLGTGGLRRWSYRYKGAPQRSSRSRGFIGFPEMRATDQQSGVVTYSQLRLDWPFLGAVSQMRAFDAPFGAHGQELLREEHAYVQKLHVNGSRHAYRSRSTRWVLEAGVTVGGTLQTVGYCYRTLSGETCPGSGTEYDHATQRSTVTVDGDAIGNPSFTPAFWGDVPARTIAGQNERRRVTEVELLANTATPWIRGAVTRQLVTHAVPGQNSATARKDIAYLSGTRVARSATRFPGDARLQVVSTRTFDAAAGNVTSALTVQGAGMTTRTWQFATPYEDGRHAAETTNPLGQVSGRSTDDRFGFADAITDPDGRTRTIEYDPFGRRVRELAADGTEIVVQHERCDLADCTALDNAAVAMKVTTITRNGSTQVAPTRVTYIDMLGRTVLEQVEAIEPGQGWHGRRIGYDNRNRVRYRSRPVLGVAVPSCGSAGPDCTWYDYDLRDRVIRETRPDGGVSSASWSGAPGRVTLARTETIKVAGQTVGTRATQTVYDVLGRVTQSTDAPGSAAAVTTAFGYDARGNLTRVTVGGVSVATLEYDLAGNRTRVIDASSGTTEFGFNALGELTRTTDAKGQVTVYEHDLLGRLVRRTDAGGIAHTWTWDPSNGTGQLGSRARPGFVESYVYGAEHGRLTRVDSQVNVPDVWVGSQTRRLEYDAAGRLTSQQYPNGQTVTFGYSATGYPTRVRSGGILLHELRGIDAFGRPADERYHDDAVRTRRSYDPGHGRLTRIETGTPGALRSIQDLETIWRTTGSLHQRLDRRGAASAADDVLDTFGYDALGRLTRQATSGAAARTLDFGYAANGNPTGKVSSIGGDLDVSAYVYGDASAPYRLSSVNLEGVRTTLSHDANGNVTAYAPAVGPRTWLRQDARNNVVRITVGPDESGFDARDEFWYDPDDRRFLGRETWLEAGIEHSRRVLSLGGDYEEVRAPQGAQWDVVQRIQVTPVVRLVRRHVAATGAWEVFPEYVHRDHLGSVDVVTDGRGAVLARTSFDPFGTRRAVDRSGDLPSGERVTLLGAQDVRGGRGFTDHEHRDRTGFVHMNGRIYDPRLGRFVAPDPLVQQPWGSQGHNRYAYVGNDPLSRTDPSGFCGRQEGYQLTVCEGVEEMLVIGQGPGAGGGYFGALNPEGGSILPLGPVGFGGFGGALAGAGWDSLFADLQARLAGAGAATGVEADDIEEILVIGEGPGRRASGSGNGWSRGLERLEGAGIRSLFGSVCFGTVLGGCGAVALQTSTGSLYGMLLVGVFPGGGVSFGTEGVLFESDFQSASGVGTAVLVSGGFGGFGGSIGMAQGTNGVNLTGAVGYGFGLGGGVGFYYAGPMGSVGN